MLVASHNQSLLTRLSTVHECRRRIIGKMKCVIPFICLRHHTRALLCLLIQVAFIFVVAAFVFGCLIIEISKDLKSFHTMPHNGVT